MPLIEGGVRDVKEIASRFGATQGSYIITSMDGDDITGIKYYDDGGNLLITETYTKASCKSLYTTAVVTNWDVSGDVSGSSITALGWIDGATSVLTATYTDSTHAGLIYDDTTDNGDISAYIGADYDEGYLTCFMKFSDFTNITSIEARIGSDSGSYQSVTLNSSVAYMSDDDWYYMVFDLSTGSSVSGPTGSNAYIAFNFVSAAGTAQTVDIHSIMMAKEGATISGETFRDIFKSTQLFTVESKTITSFYALDNTQTIFGTVVSAGY